MFGTNSIEPVQTTGATTIPPTRATVGPQTDEWPIREATRAEERRLRPDAETDAIAKQHNLYTANRWSTRIYYTDYQQKSEVMRAKSRQITTKLDDRQTVSAMLDLAQSRGWQTIKLSGSDSFKREAWVQSQVRGIKTEGYPPKNTDLQEAERRKAAAAPVAVSAVKSAPTSRTAKKAKAEGTQQRAQEKAVWNVVETSGKAAREGSSEKPAEKPPAAAAEAA
jgi:hypothetical protein